MPAIHRASERVLQVREVLRGIGAGDIRELLVFNKIDLTVERGSASGDRGRRGAGAGVGIRRRGEARGSMHCAPHHHPGGGAATRFPRTLHLTMQAAAMRSDLYRRKAVRAERQREDGSWEIDVALDSAEIDKLLGVAGRARNWMSPAAELETLFFPQVVVAAGCDP